MYNATEQFAEINQANVSNAIKLASLSIENAEKLVQLNINAAKLAIAQAVEGAQAAASAKDVQELLRVPLLGVVPESESVLHASNQGTPAIHLKGTDVAEAYTDIVARYLGENRPMRFVDYEKPGLLKRLFGGR